MTTTSRRLWTLTVLVAAFLLAGTLHHARGALDSGFGAADDEAAHLVSGVMIHDYLATPDAGHPVRFAERYYVHYPRVAIGQWPPGYHGTQALWTLLFGVSRESVVLLGAFLTALTATALFRALLADLGPAPAGAAGLCFLLLPLVQLYGSLAMTEVTLALFCTFAILAFGRLMDRGRLRYGLLFAAFAVAAIMTKANALALACLPVIAILLSRRWRLALSKPLWIAALIVALGAGPWTLYFLDVNRSTWGGGTGPNLRFSLEATRFYAAALVGLGGFLLAALALWGSFVKVRERDVEGKWIAAVAWCLSLLLFHIAIPSSIETRHLVLLAPALCMLAAAGAVDLVERVPRRVTRPRLVAAVLLFVCFASLGLSFPRKDFTGYAEAVQHIESNPDYDGVAVLVDSGSVGEGLGVSEFLLADERRPDRYVVRATKFLSQSSWTGEGYRSFFATPDEMASGMDALPVTLVLFDHTIKPHQAMAHRKTLREMLETRDEWRRVATFDVRRGERFHPAGLELWENVESDHSRPIHLEIAEILHRTIPLSSL